MQKDHVSPPLLPQLESPREDCDITHEVCGATGARQRAGAAAPSLDTKCQNPTDDKNGLQINQDEELGKLKKENSSPEFEGHKKLSWDRKQKRAYHKALTLLRHFSVCGHQVFFVTLTGSPQSDAKQLSYHHERLKLSAIRKLGLPGLEHFKVITSEGHGVIHALWAIPPAQKGFRDSAVFIPQKWLSEEWLRIHGAKIVDIRRVNMANHSRRRLSRYIVSQYCSGQSGFVRSDYTRPKWLGFSIRSTWARLKREWHSLKPICGLHFGDLCKAWESLVETRSCWLGEHRFVIWPDELVEV